MILGQVLRDTFLWVLHNIEMQTWHDAEKKQKKGRTMCVPSYVKCLSAKIRMWLEQESV